jgi:hypothetical protein
VCSEIKNECMVDLPKADSVPRLRHNDIVTEYPCSGEVIQLDAFSTKHLTIAICLGCGTEFQYVPDSTWVTIILPGMRNPV